MKSAQTVLFALLTLIGIGVVIWQLRWLRQHPPTGLRVDRKTRGRILALGVVLAVAGTAGLVGVAMRSETNVDQTLLPITNLCEDTLEITVTSGAQSSRRYTIPAAGFGAVVLNVGDEVQVQSAAGDNIFAVTSITSPLLSEWVIDGENCAALQHDIRS